MHSHRVQYYFGCYDPLQYPLLFPYGDTGWHQGIQRLNQINPTMYCQGQTSLDPSQIPSIDKLLEREKQGIDDILLIQMIKSILKA